MPEILIISRFAFKEALRKKVLLGALLLLAGYLVLYGYGLSKLPEINLPRQFILSQMLSTGLFGAGFMATLLAVLTAAGAIASELEMGTLYAVLTKPLTKTQFILGKFLGYALLLALFSSLFFLGLWGITLLVGGERLPGVFQALALFIFEPLVMLAVTFAGSALFSTMTAGVTAFLLYGIAFIGGMIEQIGSLVSNQSLINLGIISSLILPVDAIQRRLSYILSSSLSDGLGQMQSMGPFAAVSVPSGWMVLYALIYALVFLLLAVRIFQKKDV